MIFRQTFEWFMYLQRNAFCDRAKLIGAINFRNRKPLSSKFQSKKFSKNHGIWLQYICKCDAFIWLHSWTDRYCPMGIPYTKKHIKNMCIKSLPWSVTIKCLHVKLRKYNENECKINDAARSTPTFSYYAQSLASNLFICKQISI